jgi:hypothetical protein
MRRKQGDASNAVLRELRAFGLGYPGTHSKSPWPGGADDNAYARRQGDRVGTHARRMLRCMSQLVALQRPAVIFLARLKVFANSPSTTATPAAMAAIVR